MQYPDAPPVFFIGTSGKGVSALQYLAEHLTADFPAPIFFLLHRQRTSQAKRQLLPQLLKYKSQLPVVIPQTGDDIVPGTIYLPPFGQHLVIEEQRAKLTYQPANSTWRPSIDALLISGAQNFGPRTVSVLLTGGLHDGVEGLRETTRQGGITIAQSPGDAYDPTLPLNALLGDHPRYVLPLRDMPALFCELAQHPHYGNQKTILVDAAITAAKKRKAVKQQNR